MSQASGSRNPYRIMPDEAEDITDLGVPVLVDMLLNIIGKYRGVAKCPLARKGL